MASSVPEAIPAFIALCQGALPANFTVQLGTVMPGQFEPHQSLLITGIHFNEDEYAELGPSYRHEEHYNISCILSSDSGGFDQQDAQLQQVYSLYEDIQVVIANNPELTQTVRLGWCRQLDYNPSYDAMHAFTVGTLTFEVECQARVTSLN